MTTNAKTTSKKSGAAMSARNSSHADVGAFIQWFSMTIYDTKPDSMEYARWYKFVQPLFVSEDCRTYTLDQLKSAILSMLEDGIIIKTLSILSYPSILRAYVDNDKILRQQILKNILTEQQKENIGNIEPPDGW